MKYFCYLCTLETKNIEMALPIFEEFLYPFLLATSKKDMTISEMREFYEGVSTKQVFEVKRIDSDYFEE